MTLSISSAIAGKRFKLPLIPTALCACMTVHGAPQSKPSIEEVVVTAQKRQESSQDVPIAISAVSSDQLEKMKAVKLGDLQGSVPNVQIGHFSNTPNTAVFNIRGMGVIEPDPYAGNVVSVVVDGVPQYFSMISLVDMFDIERIEVLKGPQGTLFGANTTGGVVNITTEQPTGEFGGQVKVTAGNHSRRDINLAVDFPIIEDTLAGKAVVMHHQRDGWHENIVNGDDMGSRDVTAFRGYLRFTPSASLDATLITEIVRSRNGAPIALNGAVPGEAIYVEPGSSPAGARRAMYPSPCVPAGTPCEAPDDYVSASQLPDKSDMDTYGATLTVDWDSPIGDITSITGYKQFQLDEFTDQDASPFFLFNTDRGTEGWQLSQEVRNVIEPTANTELLMGTFFMATHYEHFQNALYEFTLPGLRNLNEQDQDHWSASVFLQGYLDMTENLQLQAGLRYTHEYKEMKAGISNFLSSEPGPSFTGGTPIGGFQVEKDKSWDNLGAKIGLDYSFSENFLVYGYYARGFKSGGFVGRLGIPQDIGPYDEEYVDSIEMGAKTDWFNNRLRVNVALFQNWYKDIQLASLYFTENEQGTLVQGNSILNAANAETRGMELDISAVPADGLTINASLAYLHAQYTDFPFLDPQTLEMRDLEGYHLQNAPEWSASLGVNYEVPGNVGPGTLELGARYKYVDTKYNSSIANTPRSKVQETNLVDANIGWTHESGQWSLDLWGRNIFDKRYIASVIDAPGVFANVNYAAPREWGASFNYNW